MTKRELEKRVIELEAENRLLRDLFVPYVQPYKPQPEPYKPWDVTPFPPPPIWVKASSGATAGAPD